MDDDRNGEGRGLGFAILGPLRVTCDGRPLSLGGPQQRAVLALLLIDADRPVPTERIADALWGESPPAGYTTTIQTYVFRLREALEPDRAKGVPARVLVTERGGYRLDTTGCVLDSRVFEAGVATGRRDLHAGNYDRAVAHLDAALALWRGEVLSDVAELDAVTPVAARLSELRLAAIEARVDAQLALGRHAMVVGELDALVTQYPLREHLHAQRMLALYRCGRQADALAAYRQLRDGLDRDIGVAPSPPLQHLHQQILNHDPELDAPSPAPDADAGRDNPRAEAEDTDVAGGNAHNGSAAGEAAAVPARRRRSAVAWQRARWRITVPVVVILAAGVTAAVVIAENDQRSSLHALPGNSVGIVSADGSLRDAIAVGQGPNGLAYGAGALWALNGADRTVTRIDPASHTSQTIHGVGAAPTAITVIGHDVLVANGGDGTVTEIDASGIVAVPGVGVGSLPSAIASGPSGAWVANGGDGTVQNVNAATGKAGSPIGVGAGPDGVAVGDGAVWVANSRDGTVSKLDPSTGKALDSISVGAGPKGIAVTADAVWVTNSLDLTVSRIDPTTDRVVATIGVGDGPTAVVAGLHSVWVADENDGTIAEIDSRSGHARVFAIGSSPTGLALVGSTVWVATAAFTSPRHVGGTLTIATSSLPGSTGIDPANNDDMSTVRAEGLVYSGLVGYRHIGGIAGLTLVPNLAVELPRPTDGGLSFTFTLRPNIRYSTGAPIRADDIGYGVRRVFTVGGPQTAYYTHIVGGPNCAAHPARCDLTRGVITDNATRRITFNLITPDPDFLAELTRFVYPTPARVGLSAQRAPLPGTGPYMITDYQPRQKQFILSRNPNFRMWSYAAQPAGYPETIRWEDVPDLKTGVDDVIHGRADMTSILAGTDTSQEAQIVADLARQYPAQLHPDLFFQTSYEFLNTAVGPFNDIRVRQALNWAIDRNRLVDIVGGPTLAVATCQFLPPDFPGYQPYCPYTVAGPRYYNGPDLGKAQRLVAQSGTTGQRITLYGLAGSHATDLYLVTVLRELGFHTKLTELPNLTAYYRQVFDSRKHTQIAFLYWGADFTSPANFFDTLSCRGFVPANPDANANASQFCNSMIDKLAGDALLDQTTNLVRSRELWAEVDRLVTDAAPQVDIANAGIENLVATGVGNFETNPQLGPLLDQIWVR